MKFFFIFLLFTFLCTASFAQQRTKKLIVITLDGYKWKELFRGADSSLLLNKEFTSQDSASKIKIMGVKIFRKEEKNYCPFSGISLPKKASIW